MRARIKLSAAEKGVYYVQADYDRKIVELLRQLTPESKEKLITWILEIPSSQSGLFSEQAIY